MRKNAYSVKISLLVLLLALVLCSCGLWGDNPDAPTTSIGDPSDLSPLTDAEYEAFLSLVDKKKVEDVEDLYEKWHIGEFRTLKACEAEIREVIVNLEGVRAVGDVDTATALYVSVYASALGDDYGYYYAPDDYDDYAEDLGGEYTGIGIMVTLLDSGYVEILSVFTASPAEDAGLLPGDILVAVDGEDFAVIGYQNAIDRVRGPEGTYVKIAVERNGARIEADILRRRVIEQTVDYEMLPGNVGYICIYSFDDTTYAQFVEAHRTLDAQGADSYVFDVRNNPGGTLTSVVAILEYILPDGHIVKLNYNHKWLDLDQSISSILDYEPDYMAKRVYYENHVISKPMVVLANGNTASAGELFTSSLMDYRVATVVGEQTFGKGIGQGSFPIGKDGSAMIMTVFSYDPPVQPNYHGVGIAPDVAVSLSEEAASKNLYKLTLEEDAQLTAALALLGAQ